MINIFRRHATDCKHRTKGRSASRCQCPYYGEGRTRTQRLIKPTSMKTRDETQALRIRDEWYNDVDPSTTKTRSIWESIRAFMQDGKLRNLAPSTIKHYESTLYKFAEKVCEQKIISLQSVTGDLLRDYMATRLHMAPRTRRMEMIHLRVFFQFAVENDWIDRNPARRLNLPEISDKPNKPYTIGEMQKINDACALLPEPKHRKSNYRDHMGPEEARLYVMAAFFTALRLSDLIQLRRDDLQADNTMTVCQQKTKRDVVVWLPEELSDGLKRIPSVSPYFFWDGRDTWQVARWRVINTMQMLSKLTGIRVKSHRFRNSFSMRLMESGEDIKVIADMMGHATPMTTANSYFHMTSAYRDRLINLMRNQKVPQFMLDALSPVHPGTVQ